MQLVSWNSTKPTFFITKQAAPHGAACPSLVNFGEHPFLRIRTIIRPLLDNRPICCGGTGYIDCQSAYFGHKFVIPSANINDPPSLRIRSIIVPLLLLNAGGCGRIRHIKNLSAVHGCELVVPVSGAFYLNL